MDTIQPANGYCAEQAARESTYPLYLCLFLFSNKRLQTTSNNTHFVYTLAPPGIKNVIYMKYRGIMLKV